jgi:prevent-host-death family protein
MLYNFYMTAAPEETAGIPAISLADARADLSKLANLAHYTGRPTILTRYGKPWAVIAPVSVLESLSTTGDDVDVAALSERLAALGGSTVTAEEIVAAVREAREEGGA